MTVMALHFPSKWIGSRVHIFRRAARAGSIFVGNRLELDITGIY